MKLLILTQKIDRDDSILGFFHSWIREFAGHYEKITVIALGVGNYSLPDNVKVLSLGKEKGRSRLKYLWRFYKYIFQERKNYEAVFVHMNQEYVFLGWPFWKFLRKKVFLWRNHPYGDIFTTLAVFLSNIVFCTSADAYVAKFKKTKLMPAGIDITKFKPQIPSLKIKNSLLYVGRISPVKNLETLIEAARMLDKEGVNFTLNIVGGVSSQDKNYFQKIKKLSEDLEQKGKIKFLGEVPNYKTPEIYNQNEILINLTPTGSFDKVILEAMACESLVLISNKSFEGVLLNEFIFKEKNSQELAQKIIFIFKIPKEEKENYGGQFREYVIKNQSLDKLIKKLCSMII